MQVELRDINAIIPTRNTSQDAGYDLYSVESFELQPGDRRAVRTGIALAIPDGFYGRIAGRSGLALKAGINVLGGVIDSSYRGEIKVILQNTSDQPYHANLNDKIAQLIVERYYTFDIVKVESLETSDRGDKGFGSSGA